MFKRKTTIFIYDLNTSIQIFVLIFITSKNHSSKIMMNIFKISLFLLYCIEIKTLLIYPLQYLRNK